MNKSAFHESELRTASGYPEAELPRIESDDLPQGETYAAGNSPTNTGEWAAELYIKPTPFPENTAE